MFAFTTVDLKMRHVMTTEQNNKIAPLLFINFANQLQIATLLISYR